MHRHLVHTVRARGLAGVPLLALVWLLPSTSPAQTLPGEVREAAADRLWIHDYLRLYDLLLSMQAALGEITVEAADAQLAAAGWELYDQGFHEEDLDALREALRGTANEFLDSIEDEVASSTIWPEDLPAESYRSLSSQLLRYARSEFERALTSGADPGVALRAATLSLAFARGFDALPAELDYLAGTRERAAAALPGIDLMPIDEEALALPPPAEARPPSVVTVEGQARLLGESSIDVVGGTDRLGADGKPDTEIELRLLAAGFVIENVEIRPPSGGSIVAMWSARRANGRPLMGVMSNRVLVNQEDGRLGTIRLREESPLSLYIQDDGQLARSANPGTVVVSFRGGEQATFPITAGAAAAAGEDGRITPVPIGGRSGAPPVILTSLPPRTPTAPGMRPAQPPTAIPRGLPPPQPGGVSQPAGQPPVSPPPTGAPPSIRPPITPPPASMPADGRPPAAPPPVAPAPVTPPATVPPGAAASKLYAFQARWIGVDADVVSKGSEARPDGSPDGHIQLTVSFSSWQDVTYLALYSSDANGTPAGGQVWHTKEAGYWILGALGNGVNLNVRHLPSLGRFNGTVTLDLYAGDSGWFTPGQTFLVEMGMGPMEAVTQIVQVGAAGAAPVSGAPAVPGAGAAVPADWNTRGDDHRGEVGTRYSYTCPPNGTAGPVWGTDVYTDDSSVCTAAVHAGLITLAGGGTVTIEMRAGEASYRGEARNGITSASYGPWATSFVFPRPGDPPATPPSQAEVPAGAGVPSAGDPTAPPAGAEAPAAGGPPTPLGGPSSWLTSLQASWIGLDADLVTNGAEARPDGSPDGHFRIDASFSFWQDVSYISVQSADEDGAPAGGQVWHSQNSSAWLLAVLVDGMNLNTRHVPLLGGFSGDVTFDLYAGDSGWFHPGQRFLVELGLGSGQTMTRVVQIGGGAPVTPPAVAGTPTAGPVDWNTRGESHRGEVGTRYTYPCPPNGTAGPVWGTDVYTDDSSVCTAGVHAGLITLAGGGEVTIEMRSGEPSYRGEARNGITSANYGAWGGSFVFPRPGDPPATPPSQAGAPAGGGQAPAAEAPGAAANAQRERYGAGEPIVVEFRGFPGNAQDWIEISPTGAPEESYGEWYYLGGQTTGSLQFQGLTAGTYEVRGRFNWPDGGFAVRTRSTFTIVADQPPAAANVLRGPEICGVWRWFDRSVVVFDAEGGLEATGVNAPSLMLVDRGRWELVDPAGRQYRISWPAGQDLLTLSSDQNGLGGTNVGGAVQVSATRTGACGAAPPSPPDDFDARVSYGAEWIGMDADFVGVGGSGAPDGVADAHFTFTVDSDIGSYEIRSIAVMSSDAAGNPSGGQIWHTANSGYWLLGVARQGVRLNDGHVPTLGTHEGFRSFDLYAGDSGWFQPGQHFVLEVDMGGGEPIRQVVRIPESFQQDTPSQAAPPAEPAAPDEEIPAPMPMGTNAVARPQRDRYAEGETIVVDFSEFPGYAQDWIEISPAGASDESYGQWFYLGGQTAGSLQFSGLAPGTYEVRGRFDWPNGGYAVRTRSTFTVAPNEPPVTGAAPPPAAQEPAAPPTAQYRVTGLSAMWIGVDADVVSTGTATVPDGAADGRFRVDITIEGSVELRSVSLYSSDAQGNPAGGQVWTTASGTGWWVLGVGAGGRLLHNGQVEGIGVLQSGTTWLDLFAGNSGWFNPGQTFLVELAFADGQKASQVVQVTGDAAPPVSPPPAAGGVTPGATPIEWGRGPMEHRGQIGQRFAYVCSPNGSPGPLWGTGIHTDDSSVCTAAVHAGFITFASGGTVTIEIRPGQSSYTGSPGYGGANSLNWGPYEGSFMVVGADGAAAPAPTAGVLPAQDFYAPMWGGLRLDLCLVWGGQCGEPAATEFCRQSGYTKATAWEIAYDVGTQTPTFVLGTGQVCNEPGCDGFVSITCSQ